MANTITIGRMTFTSPASISFSSVQDGSRNSMDRTVSMSGRFVADTVAAAKTLRDELVSMGNSNLIMPFTYEGDDTFTGYAKISGVTVDSSKLGVGMFSYSFSLEIKGRTSEMLFESNIIDLLKSKNYTEFSVLLQQIEARILLKNICKRIHQKDHSIPLFTIHDDIITTNCNEIALKNEILTTYKEILGVSPELKTEKLNKANLDFKTFRKTIIKKTQKIAKNNGLDWINPEEEFWIKHLDTFTFNFITKK